MHFKNIVLALATLAVALIAGVFFAFCNAQKQIVPSKEPK